MTQLALAIKTGLNRQLLWAIPAVLTTFIIAGFGVSINQALAFILSAIVLTIWAHNKSDGLICALIFFFVKPLIVRIAYAIDFRIFGEGGFDLLGVTPALLLAGLIVWHLILKINSGDRLITGRTRLWLVLFSAAAFLSIFNPGNSILVGLGGFERNVLPNMLILLLASYVFAKETDSSRLLKSLIVLGILSCLYGIGQHLLGIYPWEKGWMLNVAFKETSDGWLTIGLRGVVFRPFSFYFNYMDFTFCSVIIFAMAIAYRSAMSPRWQKLIGCYVVLWFMVLLLSLERTPLLMSLVALTVIYYLKSDAAKRIRIIWKTALASLAFVLTMSLAAPILKNTGAQSFIRLAELANPLAASSIADRVDKNWGPTLNTIYANPLGVGIGYGSATRADAIASQTGYWVKPHNELLQKTLETGVIGGILFLLLLIAVYRDSLKLSHAENSDRLMGIGFAAVSVGFWLCGMVNVPFSGSSGMLYWALAGVVLAALENAKKSVQTADISKS